MEGSNKKEIVEFKKNVVIDFINILYNSAKPKKQKNFTVTSNSNSDDDFIIEFNSSSLKKSILDKMLNSLPNKVYKSQRNQAPRGMEMGSFSFSMFSLKDNDFNNTEYQATLLDAKNKSISNHINNLLKYNIDLNDIKVIGDLDLSGCTNLEKLPNDLKVGGYLNLSRCTNLKELPNDLKVGKGLELSRCTNLKELPNDLKVGGYLGLSRCTNLKELPNGLKVGDYLNLSGCTNLKELPNDLKVGGRLDLSGCTGLPNNIETINKLKAIEKENANNPNFSLIWPDHLCKDADISAIKNKLENAYRQYYNNDEEKKQKAIKATDSADFPVYCLIHRFLTESTASRGSIKKIKDSAEILVDRISENPQLLEFMNESARPFLDACVNQPVAGFLELSVIAEISSKPEIISKIESAKILKAFDIIKEEVKNIKNNNGNTIGAEVEVELYNAMVREVNNKLLQDKIIEKPWPGIADGIAYEDIIKNFLTENNKDHISKEVIKRAINSSKEDMKTYLCEGHLQDTWAQLIIPSAEYRKNFKKKNDIINAIKGVEESEESQYKQISEIENEFRDKNIEYAKELTEKAYDNIPTNSNVEKPKAVQSNKQQQNTKT